MNQRSGVNEGSGSGSWFLGHRSYVARTDDSAPRTQDPGTGTYRLGQLLARPPHMAITVHERSARDIAGGRRILLSIEDGEQVPGLLLLPATRQPRPAALLLHGYSSRKERMSDVIGTSLLRHGIASLAIDLPLHGERYGEVESLSYRNPFELVQRRRLAVSEARLGLRFLAQHMAVDRDRLALVGYSLGSFLGTI